MGQQIVERSVEGEIRLENGSWREETKVGDSSWYRARSGSLVSDSFSSANGNGAADDDKGGRQATKMTLTKATIVEIFIVVVFQSGERSLLQNLACECCEFQSVCCLFVVFVVVCCTVPFYGRLLVSQVDSKKIRRRFRIVKCSFQHVRTQTK